MAELHFEVDTDGDTVILEINGVAHIYMADTEALVLIDKLRMAVDTAKAPTIKVEVPVSVAEHLVQVTGHVFNRNHVDEVGSKLLRMATEYVGADETSGSNTKSRQRRRRLPARSLRIAPREVKTTRS